MVWKSPGSGDFQRTRLGEDAHAAELRAAAAAQLDPRGVVELRERLGERCLEKHGRLVVIGLRASVRLGDDAVDHPELEAMERVGLERRRGLLRLTRVAPEDRGATFRGDHRVDGVLLHQHAVGDRDRNGAAGAALADDAGDGRHRQARHLRLRPGDRPALAVLLGGDTRVGARGVDEREDGEPEPLGDLHDAHRLVVALGIRHPELPVEALLHVASLLVPDHDHGATVELREPGDERSVVGTAAIAVELDPVVEHALHVIHRVGAVGVPGELDRVPDRLVGRVGVQPFELANAGGRPHRRRAPHAGAAGARGPRVAGGAKAPDRDRSCEQPQETRKMLALLRARHDRVEVAEPQILLGEPEVVGKLLASRLLHDTRAGERDQRARLSDRHVAERGKRREHARRRRMRHHREHRQMGIVEVLDGAHRLRQLHQRQDPFLHARAAR